MHQFQRLSSWVALALVLAVVSTASAQQEGQGQGGNRGPGGQRGGFGGPGFGGPGGGRGGFGFGGPGGGGADRISLLGIEQVQKELSIASDQTPLLNELIGDFREQQREMFTGFGNFRELSEEERQKAMTEINARREKLQADFEKDLAVFLTADQSKRLDQIVIQQQGLRALANPETAGKLGLSDDQKKQIRETFEAQMNAMRDAFPRRGEGGQAGQPDQPRPDFAAIREKMEAQQKETETKVMAVLTAEQKKQFEDMKGKPFELDRRGFGGFGGRPPGGRPGEGGGRPGEGDANRPRRPAAE